MATRYWVGGVGGNWSDSSKWSATSGGAGGATVPGSADVAIINATSLNTASTITVDVTTTVTTLTISAVDVMVTLASAGNLTVTGTVAISTNTTYTNGLTINGNATFGALTLTSGTLSLGTSNIIVNGIVTITGTTTRTLAFGSGSISVNVNLAGATTVWSGATLTGCTISGSKDVNFSFTGTPFTASITNGSTSGGTYANSINIASITSSISSSHSVLIAGHFNEFNLGSLTQTLSNSTRTIYGSITLNSALTLTTGVAVTTISNRGFDKTITSNGVAFNFPITINSSGIEKIFLLDAMTILSPRTLTLTAGYIDLNGFTLTCYTFSSTGLSARGIDFTTGGGNMILNVGTITGTTTIWSCATITNMTLTNSSVSVIVNAAGGLVATINHGASAGQSGSNRLNITGFTTSSSPVVVTTFGHFGSLNLDDPAGALVFENNTTTVYSNLTIGATTITSTPVAFPTVTMSAGTEIRSNGAIIDFPLVIAAGGSACRLLDAISITGSDATFTLTSGTLDLNGFTMTTRRFTSSNANSRSISFNAGNIVVSTALSSTTSIWNVATATNFSYSGTWNVSYNITGSGIAQITHGTTGGSETTAYASLVNPTATNILSITGHFIDIDLSGISNGILTPSFSVYRDLKFSGSSGLSETTAEITFRGSTYIKTLTMNGNTLNSNLRLNAEGGTLFLNDAFQSNKSLTITAGTFDANDFNFTAKAVNLFSAGTKGLNMKSGLWTITGSATSVTGDSYTWIPWNLANDAANPSFTFNKGTANILLLAFADNHTSNFYGGDLTYNKVSIGGNYTGTQVTFYNNNTFDALESLKSVAATIKFNDGTTQTISNWSVNGTTGNLITIASVSTGTHTLSKSSGTVSASYLDISNSVATGGADWQAYTSNGNIDSGGNSGWSFFTAVVSALSNFFVFF